MYPPPANDPHQPPGSPAGQPAWPASPPIGATPDPAVPPGSPVPPGPPRWPGDQSAWPSGPGIDQPRAASGGPSDPAKRPPTVTLAGVAYLGQAVMGVAAAGLALFAYTRVTDNADAVAAQGKQTPEAAELVDFVTGMVFGMLAYSLMAALLLAPLAFGVLRGSKVGRILAWVGSGLMLLVGCCSYPLLMINATGNNTTSCTNDGCADTAYREIIGFPVMGGLSALTIIQWLLIAAAGIMLALPPSHRWFKATAASKSR